MRPGNIALIVGCVIILTLVIGLGVYFALKKDNGNGGGGKSNGGGNKSNGGGNKSNGGGNKSNGGETTEGNPFDRPTTAQARRAEIEAHKLYTGDYWGEYRLADVVRGVGKTRTNEYLKDHLYKKWPNSLAAQYINIFYNDQWEEAPTREHYSVNNYDVLEKLINSDQWQKAPSQTAVVHLRLGDTISFDEKGRFRYFAPSWTRPYIRPLSFYRSLKLPVTNVIIVAGAHINKNIKASRQYLQVVKEILERKGHSVTIRTGKSPDSDFVFMSSASIFVVGGGGFSRLVKDLVERSGGIIIGGIP